MSGSQSLTWNDAHFCGLRSQTNVYSLSKLNSQHNKTKLLATSIDGHLASVEFEYNSSFEKIVPITNVDVLFDSVLDANNPDTGDDTEVVSMDVVHNWNHEGENILALTYLKLQHYDEDKPPEAFLNIYQLLETEEKCVDASKSLLQELRLDFIPFKLTHHHISVDGGCMETCLLISGGDHKIHAYQPTADHKGFEKVDATKIFPELSNIADNVTQLEVRKLDDLRRLTSFGTQNGLVGLCLINVQTKEILNSWTSEMDSPVTSLHFFHQHMNTRCPDVLNTKVSPNACHFHSKEGEGEDQREEEEEEPLHLLVTSAIDASVVYHDVLSNGLSKCRVLPISNSQDVVLCSCVMDVDFDGENEIMIGTYGQVLMVYKLMYEKPQVYTSTPFHTPMPVPIHSDTPILSSEAGDKPAKQEATSVQEKDTRRRHKTVAVTCSENEASSIYDQSKPEEGSLMDGTSQQALLSRLFRSQENLTLSPSNRSIQFETPDHMLTPDLTIPHFAVAPVSDFPCYKLIWTRRFCNPIMGLACDDVMGDGMLDLVVLTLKGLHILQPDLHEVAAVILNRLETLCTSSQDPLPPKEDVTNDQIEDHE